MAVQTQDPWSKLADEVQPDEWHALASDLRQEPIESHPWYQRFAHGAVEGFSRLGELATRVEQQYSKAVGGALSHVLPSSISEGFASAAGAAPQVHPESLAQSVAPITAQEHESAATVGGQALGGVAQVPLVAALAPGLVPAVFGGESTVQTYDAAKARGASEEEAWKAAVPQGLLSAATTAVLPKILGRLNVHSGGWLAQAAKTGAAGAAVGQVDQVVSNLIHKATDEPERMVWTGMKGRAATDALVGMVMSAVFPGTRPAPEAERAAGQAQPAVVPEIQAAPERPAPPAEPQHPAQAEIDELAKVTGRMSELEAKSKDMRQRGLSQQSTKFDRERIDLLRRQQALGLEIMTKGQAAAPKPEPTAETHPVDDRLLDSTARNDLRLMVEDAGWTTVGGQPIVKGDPSAGRTPWVPKAEWWLNRPEGTTEAQAKGAVAKALSEDAGRLGVKQKAIVRWMLDHVDAERNPPGFEALQPHPEGEPPIDVERATKLAVNGQPPGPPKPPVEEAALPPPEARSSSGMYRDWLGDRWEGSTWARIEAAKKYDSLKRILGLKFFSAKGQAALAQPKGEQPQDRVAYGIQLGIDAYGKLDDAFARTSDRLPADAIEALKSFTKLDPEQHKAISSLAEQIRTENGPEGFGGVVQEAGIIQQAKENYTRRIYEPEVEGKSMPGRAKFSTFTTAALPRSYDTILDALADGKTLKVKSAIDAQMIAREELTRVIADRNFIKQGKKAGILAHDTFGDHAGWKQIEHPSFKDWDVAGRIQLPTSAQEYAKIIGDSIGEPVPIEEGIKLYGWAKQGREAQVLGRDIMFKANNETGTITILRKQPLYAPPELANDVNAVLSRSDPNAFDRFQNSTKRLLLKVPLIHSARVMGQQFLTGAWESPADANPLSVYKRGFDNVNEYGADLRYGVRNGLQLGVAPEFSEALKQQRTLLGRWIDQVAARNNITKTGVEWLRNVTDLHADFLFHKLLPSLQARTYLSEFDNQKMRGFDEGDAAVAGARAANTSLGNLNLQDLGRNAKTQRWLNRTFFAPMWLESNMRKATEAFEAGAVGEANRLMWGRLLMRYAAIHTAGNLTMALLEDPKNPTDQYLKNLQRAYGSGLKGLLGIDITPALAKMGRTDPRRFYVSILGGYADTAKMAASVVPGPLHVNPLQFGEDKLNVAGRAALMVLTGKDRLDRTVTTLPELAGQDDKGTHRTNRIGKYAAGMPKGGKLFGQFTSWQSDAKPGPIDIGQVPSAAAYQVQSNLPIHIQNGADFLRGNMDGWEMLIRNFVDVSLSPHEKVAK